MADHPATPTPPPLRQTAGPFLDHLDRWLGTRPRLALPAAACGLVVVDLVHGFVDEGPLASPRVAALVPRVAEMIEGYGRAGGRALCLTEDAHPPDAPEFAAFPPHCLEGSSASRTVPPILEAAARAGLAPTVLPKATIAPQDYGLLGWAEAVLDADPATRTLVVAGDVTDLCCYQTVMALRLFANRPVVARRLGPLRVVATLDGIDTYDLPVEAAATLGVLPHPADLHHAVFAHHLALNGVVVVAAVDWR